MRLHRGACLVLLSAFASASSEDSRSSTEILGLDDTPVSLANVAYPFSTPLSGIVGFVAAAQAAVTGLILQLGTTLNGTLTGAELKFYGQSPPVYPSPSAAGTDDWADAFTRAQALVSQMTIQEKANITFGQSATHGCSGFTGTVDRLGFPGICLNDAESGVRTGELVSGYPAQLHVGASWNRDLAKDRAAAVANEFKGKGINVLLGPVAGPLGRVAKGGRNWEGFGNDPYLSGALIGPTISGMQEHVVACVKHWIFNEQETNRQAFLLGFIPGLGQQSVSSNVDDRTAHELYMWPFYDALHAGVGSVMCSYNRANNSYACQNSKLMNGLLKTELGFQGFVVSDWYATHTGIAAHEAGLDMVMPGSQFLKPADVEKAINNGSFSESRLDDQATRIIASWYRYAEFDDPGQDIYTSVDVRTPEADAINLQSAIEGHVLVKNSNNALPLSKPKTLSLFGFDAVGGKNTSAQGPFLSELGLANTQHYPDGRPFTILDYGILAVELDHEAGPSVALDGTLITGGGSGAVTPNYTIAPADAFTLRAQLDGTALHTDYTSNNPSIVASNDPCLVFINEQSAESWDRSTLAEPYSDSLVLKVAAKCSNTIVVIHNAGIRLVDNFYDHPNVTAILYAHLPGQFSGTALVELLHGSQSPSGRLPYTVAKFEDDYGALLNPAVSDDQYPQSDFSEGLKIDYRHFVAKDIEPRFPFGFGLTYSNFSYSSLRISLTSDADTSALPPDQGSTPVPQGGLASLYDVVATVSCTVTNTGAVAAAEVAQLYVGIPGSGIPKALRGFDKHSTEPGQSATYSFPLRRRDLSNWDVIQQQWILAAGAHQIMVGKDVLDIQLQDELRIG